MRLYCIWRSIFLSSATSHKKKGGGARRDSRSTSSRTVQPYVLRVPPLPLPPRLSGQRVRAMPMAKCMSWCTTSHRFEVVCQGCRGTRRPRDDRPLKGLPHLWLENDLRYGVEHFFTFCSPVRLVRGNFGVPRTPRLRQIQVNPNAFSIFIDNPERCCSDGVLTGDAECPSLSLPPSSMPRPPPHPALPPPNPPTPSPPPPSPLPPHRHHTHRILAAVSTISTAMDSIRNSTRTCLICRHNRRRRHPLHPQCPMPPRSPPLHYC